MVATIDPVPDITFSVPTPVTSNAATVKLKYQPIWFNVPQPEVHTSEDGIAKLTFVVPEPTMATSYHTPQPAVMTFSVPSPAITTSHFTLAPCVMSLRPKVPAIAKHNRQPSLRRSPVLNIQVMDIPPLRDEDAVTPGMYFSATAGFGGDFRGGVVYESRDDGVTFERMGAITEEAVVGELDILGLPETVYGIWDRTTWIGVRLTTGELASSTPDKVANGANWCLLGGEIIGFVNATLIGTRKYRLENLIRGMRDTHDFMDQHVVGEEFTLLLDEEGRSRVSFFPLRGAIEGRKTRQYKIVSPGSAIGSAVAEEVTIGPRNVTPFSPGNVTTRLGDGSSESVKFRWRRRTRARVRTPHFAPVPMMDDTEAYQITITDFRRQTEVQLTANRRTVANNEEVLEAEYDPGTGDPPMPEGEPDFEYELRQVGASNLSKPNGPLEEIKT
jgi:hypothetical protein